MSSQLSCINHVKRGSNGLRPELVRLVRCANDLFNDNGDLKTTVCSERPVRPSTIRLPTGAIVERHGFVCPDCLDKFEGPTDLLAHYENKHATGFFAAVKRYVREMPLGVKIGTILAFPLTGLTGSSLVLGANEIARRINKGLEARKAQIAKKTD